MRTRNPTHFALAGLAIGAAAGIAVGLDRASAVEPAAFFGLIGLGLGYALHDFNWRARKRTAAVIGAIFSAPLIAIATMIGLGVMPFDPAGIPALVGGGIGAGGLLTLLGYGVHSVFHPENAEGLVRNMPPSTTQISGLDWDDFERERDRRWDRWHYSSFYSWWGGNIWHKD